MMELVFDSVKNIVEKGENAGYHHFLLFSQCFQKASTSWSLNVGNVWSRVKAFINPFYMSEFFYRKKSTVETVSG